jgi:hypothetical protein
VRSSVKIAYEHDPLSGVPGRLNASAIWKVAAEARRQLCPNPLRLPVDVGSTLKRMKQIEANGIRLDVHVELINAVVDADGNRVLGMTAHDRRWPGSVNIRLNVGLIGAQETLLRSTFFHEFGHVIFDAPAWTRAAQNKSDRRYLQPATAHAANRIDWCEWRANEFMGGFLVPRQLLHGVLIKRAAAGRLPLCECGGGLPILDNRHVGEDRLSALVFELAELFGLSDAFIATRLHKYRLLASSLTRR